MSFASQLRTKSESIASKYFRYPRHLAALLKHSGVSKTANVLTAEAERLLRRSRLSSKPYYYFVDPCNACNLRCPLCPTGLGVLERSRGMLKHAEYLTLLNKIAPYAVEVSLHNWGEPLLNPDIFEIVADTQSRGIATNLSSNLSIQKPNLGVQIVESGLEYLIVSLDGVTQDTYGRYRVRGDIGLVMDNLRSVVEAKRRLNSKRPIIEWQFLVFKHNEHEMEAARELAPRLGVDRLRFRSPGFMHDDYRLDADPRLTSAESEWMPANPAFWDLHPAHLRQNGYLWNGPCHYLYRSMTINPGGGAAACCIIYKERQDFGNLLRDDLDAIWNNPSYQQSRALFARRPAEHSGTVCEKCYLFKRPRGPAAERRAGSSILRPPKEP